MRIYAFQFAARHGLGALLKDGYRTFTGIDEVTAKNIEACKTLTDIIKTSLGESVQSSEADKGALQVFAAAGAAPRAAAAAPTAAEAGRARRRHACVIAESRVEWV